MVTKKPVNPPPTLQAVIKKIRAEMDWTQEEMELALKLPGQAVNRAERPDAKNWSTHWTFFLKILPLCLKFDLLGERDLLWMAGHDPQTDKGDNPPRKAKGDRRSRSDDDSGNAG